MAALPTCCLGAEADPWCKASVRGHPDRGPAGPSSSRRMGWLVVPRRALKRRARQPPPRQSKDVSWVLVLRCNPGRYRGPGPAPDWGGMLFEPVGSCHPGSSKRPPRCSSSYASQGVRAGATQPLILTGFGPETGEFPEPVDAFMVVCSVLAASHQNQAQQPVAQDRRDSSTTSFRCSFLRSFAARRSYRAVAQA